eukprot:scaffold46524_cov69-Phaeocystis_antarctica.AAC.3
MTEQAHSQPHRAPVLWPMPADDPLRSRDQLGGVGLLALGREPAAVDAAEYGLPQLERQHGGAAPRVGAEHIDRLPIRGGEGPMPRRVPGKRGCRQPAPPALPRQLVRELRQARHASPRAEHEVVSVADLRGGGRGEQAGGLEVLGLEGRGGESAHERRERPVVLRAHERAEAGRAQQQAQHVRMLDRVQRRVTVGVARLGRCAASQQQGAHRVVAVRGRRDQRRRGDLPRHDLRAARVRREAALQRQLDKRQQLRRWCGGLGLPRAGGTDRGHDKSQARAALRLLDLRGRGRLQGGQGTQH